LTDREQNWFNPPICARWLTGSSGGPVHVSVSGPNLLFCAPPLDRSDEAATAHIGGDAR
jgi:hypothetical protein